MAFYLLVAVKCTCSKICKSSVYYSLNFDQHCYIHLYRDTALYHHSRSFLHALSTQLQSQPSRGKHCSKFFHIKDEISLSCHRTSYKPNYMVYICLSPSILYLSVAKCISSSFFFYCQVVFLCVDISQFDHPSSC